jgi:uncharacterized protein
LLSAHWTRTILTEMEAKILRALKLKTVAVVGISADPSKASYRVAEFLRQNGYAIVPVRPDGDVLFGEKIYHSLGEIPFHVDIVNVFRKPEFCAEVAKEAVSIGAKVLWLQLGIVSREAAAIAEAAGLEVIMDRCMAIEFRNLS